MPMKKLLFTLSIACLAILSGCSNDDVVVEDPFTIVVDSQESLMKSAAEIFRRVDILYKLMNSGTQIGSQKYIDMYTDILASDVAVIYPENSLFRSASKLIGGGKSDEFNRWTWAYGYAYIQEANKIIARCNYIFSSPVAGTMSRKLSQQLRQSIGHCLFIRAYTHYNLLNMHIDPTYLDKPVMLYYTEKTPNELQPLLNYDALFAKITDDLEEATNKLLDYERPRDKIHYADADISKVIMSYMWLNRGVFVDSEREKSWQSIKELLIPMLNTDRTYSLIPLDKVTKDGFNTVANSRNVMWGIDVDAHNSFGVNSFWSYVDIFSNGYAFRNDYLGIDQELYQGIGHTYLVGNDVRKGWWNSEGSKKYPFAAYSKFFDKEREFGGDNSWLNDIIFMRFEEPLLIIAEAAKTLGKDSNLAKETIKILAKERVDGKIDFIDTMSDKDLEKYIADNWRIEFWLEGKSLAAIKRLNWTKVRGDNHSFLKGVSFNGTAQHLIFEVPDNATYMR